MFRNCCLLALLLTTVPAFGQDKDTLVTGSFEGISAKQFIAQIEARTPYYFYYDETQLDSVVIYGTFTNLPVRKVLELAFDHTDFHFSIDRLNHIYLTRKVAIVTTLPSDYFEVAGKHKEVDHIKEAGAWIADKNTAGKWENRLYSIGVRHNNVKAGNVLITGYVRNARSGEPVINASIYLDTLNTIMNTDSYGYYSFLVPTGQHVFNVQAIGMKDARFRIMVYGEGKLDLELKEQVNTLREVIVTTQKASNIKRVQLGLDRLSIRTIKTVPTVFGETDILRVITTLPGVKTVGEASTGLNVRGGSADQNLILLNDATVYNPTHFFGMFSAFNPEVVKDVELYKSSIPAKYGGRLSSVLDIGMREGNKKQFSGSAGIGLITSRLNIEGPIQKDRTSFIFGGRTTYANWLLKLLPSPYNNAEASFNDINFSINHKANKKNDLYVTAYFSNDHFNLAADTFYNYSNRNVSLKWRHNFTSKLIGVFVAGCDQYRYKLYSEQNKVNAFTLGFDISQLNLRSDFTYLLNTKHSLGFGVSSILYKLHPGSLQPRGSASQVSPDRVGAEQALESAVYVSDQYSVSDAFTIQGGIRYSLFNNLGPQQVTLYEANHPKERATIIDTKWYGSNQVTKTYSAPELRLSLRYAFSSTFSIKAGYNSLMQYVHVLSNTTAMAPTDIWKLSDPNLKPQRGDQLSVGFYKNLKSNTIETSLELYHKKINDYLDYKSGAVLIMNHHIETEVINTKGKAYGIEMMIKRPGGKLNGWISYTYSRVLLKMDDPAVGAPVNHGAYYPASYDKPHDVTLVSNFKVNHRFGVSLNVNYSTGRPITLPISRFYFAGAQRVLYSERNAYRIPDYFRSDIALNIDGNHKVKQKTHNSWTIGVYNITGKGNPYSVYYITENGVVNGYKLSIFGSAIPFVNFNIRF